MTQEIIERQDPYTEAYRRGLFESSFDLVNQRLGFERVPTGQEDEFGQPIYETVETGTGPIYAPTRQVAGLTPMQQQARTLAQENLGGFMPYIQGGLGQIQRGQGFYEQAAQLAGETREIPFQYGQAGAEAIQGGMGAFRPGTLDDPDSGIAAFYNPFEDRVVGQVQRDFDIAGRQEEARQAAQAVGAGAFGGSRAAVTEQQALEGLNRQELDALSRLRTAGYSEALSAAQQAQEAQQRRALTGGAYLGNIGQALGTVGQRDVQILGDVVSHRIGYEHSKLVGTNENAPKRSNCPRHTGPSALVHSFGSDYWPYGRDYTGFVCVKHIRASRWFEECADVICQKLGFNSFWAK
jgi:hypothetical protein